MCGECFLKIFAEAELERRESIKNVSDIKQM